VAGAAAPAVAPQGDGGPGGHGARGEHERQGCAAGEAIPTAGPAAAPSAAPSGAAAVAPGSATGAAPAAEVAGLAPAPEQPPAPAAPVPGVTPTPAAPFAPAPVAATIELTRASLHGAIDKVHDLVRVAATRGGHARATLQLKPVELGLVEVRLRTTREGLVATITAQDAAGLGALQHAGGELRRSLEDRGVTLARLDLQLSPGGQDGAGAGGDRGRAFGGTRGSASSSRPTNPTADDDPDGEDVLVATVSRAPGRGLVDVQA
jgi:hypothetical protein